MLGGGAVLRVVAAGRASKFGLECDCVSGKERQPGRREGCLCLQVSLFSPQTLECTRGVVSGPLPRGPGSRLKSRLWGLSAKLGVDQAVGLSYTRVSCEHVMV